MYQIVWLAADGLSRITHGECSTLKEAKWRLKSEMRCQVLRGVNRNAFWIRMGTFSIERDGKTVFSVVDDEPGKVAKS